MRFTHIIFTSIAAVLLVVAITPSLFRAQNASDQAQAKLNLRTIQLGLETYRTDLGVYPLLAGLVAALRRRVFLGLR